MAITYKRMSGGMMTINENVVQAVTSKLKKCLQLEKKDSLAIICDLGARAIADLIYRAVRAYGTEAFIFQSECLQVLNGHTATALEGLLASVSTAVIIHPGFERTHLMNWCQELADTRVLFVNSTNQLTFQRWMKSNFVRIAERTNKITDIFTIGKRLDLTTPSGTELVMSIKACRGFSDAGIFDGKGNCCSLPAGEGSVEPVPESVEGRLVVNFVAGALSSGKTEPAQLLINNGLVTQIRGDNRTAKLLRNQLKRSGTRPRYVVKFSVGTNDRAELGFSSAEDRKVLGCASIALGTIPIEPDTKKEELTCGMLLSPTLCIDGRKIMENGRFNFV